MSPPVEFQLDREVNALYVKVGPGRVARTIALTDSVYVDVDAQDSPVGIEFTNADELIPFLRTHAAADLPPKIRDLFRVTGA